MPLLLLWGGSEGRSPSGKSFSFAFDLPGLGLGPPERAEKGRCRPEKWISCGGEVPSTPPPVELIAEEAPQTPYRQIFRERLKITK